MSVKNIIIHTDRKEFEAKKSASRVTNYNNYAAHFLKTGKPFILRGSNKRSLKKHANGRYDIVINGKKVFDHSVFIFDSHFMIIDHSGEFSKIECVKFSEISFDV